MAWINSSNRRTILMRMISLLILAAASAFAGDGLVGKMQRESGGGYGAAGCGLGALLFGDQKGSIQIIAATFNGTEGNQTFAISTGTSNCTEDGVALADRERELFAEANFNLIKEEAATGAGENVAVLASLYGCSGATVNAFTSGVQSKYLRINEATTAPEMLEAIDGVAVSTCHAN